MNNIVKTACLFGGQGSQYTGMGKDLYDLDEDCRRIFETASDVMGYDMAELCFYGEQDKLNKTLFSQPTVLTIDLCAFTLAVKQGFSFQALAGFSLGEYAALVAAQSISIREAYELIKKRAAAMDSVLVDGVYGMAAVSRLSAEKCESICSAIKNGYARVVNYNSNRQVSIAGNEKGLAAFEMIANECGGKTVALKVNRPFHSQLMRPAADIYRKDIESFEFADPIIPVYMNVTGDVVTSAGEIKTYLVKQIDSPVLWTKTLKNMHLTGIERYLECGPKKVLCRFVEDTLGLDNKKTIFFESDNVKYA